MRRRIVLLALACMFFFPHLLFAQNPFPDSSALAYLSVLSHTPGMAVLIAGNEVGETPLREFPLSAGKYEVVVRNAHASSWLDEDWQQSVKLSPGDTATLFARMINGYLINSIPYGAEVWRNGELLGTTPYVLRMPENQIAQVEVRQPSYVALQVEVGRREEQLARKRRYDLVLTRDFDYTSQQQRQELERSTRAGRYRKLTYLSAAISLAAGVGSVLLKREADAAYDQYLVTGDPNARAQQFNRAEKYDRYYAASFAVFEVSFALSFYSFLKSRKE